MTLPRMIVAAALRYKVEIELRAERELVRRKKVQETQNTNRPCAMNASS